MAVTLPRSTSPLDVAKIRGDFPVLARKVHGTKTLVYLDNAATSQKPRQVIDAVSAVFLEHNANIHRGVYEFSEATTAAFEGAREGRALHRGGGSARDRVRPQRDRGREPRRVHVGPRAHRGWRSDREHRP